MMQLYLVIEQLADKAGGPFHAAALLQKRMRQLNHGAQPLIRTKEKDPMRIAAQEILAGVIVLEEFENRSAGKMSPAQIQMARRQANPPDPTARAS